MARLRAVPSSSSGQSPGFCPLCESCTTGTSGCRTNEKAYESWYPGGMLAKMTKDSTVEASKRPVTPIWITLYGDAARRVCLALFGCLNAIRVVGGGGRSPRRRRRGPHTPHAPKSAKSRGSKNPATALTPANRHRVERRHIPTERMEMPTIVDARTVRTALRRRSNQAWTNPRPCRRKGGCELAHDSPNAPLVMKQSPGKNPKPNSHSPSSASERSAVIPGRTHPTTPLRPHCPTKTIP
ncbi:hypothetical protein DFH09DRAFT_1277766 [Mycena vulgaris]|nr:hypothetical protein DFH09DRAFT_1277766 [Mycena vulgaris]